MAAFFRKYSRKRGESSLPSIKDKGRQADSASAASHFFETSTLVEAGLFALFTVLVVIISFLGQKPKGPQIILNQPASNRIVAEFPFEYTSSLLAEEEARAVRAQVPPVFQRTFEPYERFRQFIADLNSSIAKNQIENEDEGEEAVRAALSQMTGELITATELELEAETILSLTQLTTPKERSTLFNDSMAVLKALYEDGIYTSQDSENGSPEVTVVQLVDEEGKLNLPNARSETDATVALRVRINSLSPNTATARALFDLFRSGLEPNLLYSAGGTNRAIERAIAKLKPPVIRFKEGDTLIEPGVIIAERDIERLTAYHAAVSTRGESLIWNELFLKRFTLTLVLLIAVYIYVKQGLRDVHKRNRAIAVTAVSILLNLLIIRTIIELGELTLLNSRPALSMLPYIAPYALAPIIVAVLVGGAPAVLSALIVATVFGIIQNDSIDFLLIAFLSGVVGSFVSLNIRKRAKLLRAGLLAGATAAITGSAIALLNGYSFSLIGQQTFVALVVGLLTGIIAVGIIPIFEQAFNITTEITLLELTDFNHPLLRRMQMEAPGTYHHSLMVSNLAENAAASIGASPLLCRACSYFHDIGKLVKPEYFAENQRDGVNPHDEKNPSMSALVIKAHVKEGVEMARKNKLPRVIMDVIRQHHGTSLIHYFYYQAQQKEKDIKSGTNGKSGKKDAVKVDESTYRYDGPRPAFKESAIIFFADGIEAASRSLKKVTQPAVEELIDSLISSRIADGQLDDCPLTFKELEQIRSSFEYTLLNMLHARVEYPKEEKDDTAANAKSNPREKEENVENATVESGNQQPI
ncbi:HD family phosphohydrolase [Coraliomargarita parva]|uniref:HD family phosphohydrolase n=1 Tax=Coraliomargarita parva TaxID=3014050 RepID=UPI0022B3417F|nr:HDIG domain-containing metalloprotein [Coraliomargarita parva]